MNLLRAYFKLARDNFDFLNLILSKLALPCTTKNSTIASMKLLMATCMLLVLCPAMLAQSKDELAVAAAAESLRKAMLDNDKTALDKLVAADLSYVHSSGSFEDKSIFVGDIASGKNDWRTLEISNQVITVLGDIAIVRHKATGELYNNGKPVDINISVMQIWQKQKGSWKFLARQAFKP